MVDLFAMVLRFYRDLSDRVVGIYALRALQRDDRAAAYQPERGAAAQARMEATRGK